MSTTLNNSISYSEQSNLCWLVDRGLIDDYEKPNLTDLVNIESKSESAFIANGKDLVYFVYENSSLSLLEQELLNKIIAALPAQKNKYKVLSARELLSSNLITADNLCLFFGDKNILQNKVARIVVFPAISEMIKDTSLKKPVWLHLKKIFNF